MTELFGFIWGHSAYLYTFFFILIFAFSVLWASRRQLKLAYQLGLATRGDILFKNYSRGKKILRTLLLIFGLTLIWIALMRPQREEGEETVQTEGRDWVIALDISRSMLAKDMRNETVDRLTFAKEKIRSLVKRFGSDRVSLILFAGSAFVYCPLTADHGAFLSLLDAIDTQMIASGSTSLEQPIQKALEIFAKVPERKSKVLVMFTDGEDFSPELYKLKKRIQSEGLNIFTIGIGTPGGAPIPVFDKLGKQIGFQKEKNGSVVITRLDEGLLKELAQQSGGQYLSPTENNKDIITLSRQLERFEKEALSERKMARRQEFYYYFSGLAGLLLLIEWLL